MILLVLSINMIEHHQLFLISIPLTHFNFQLFSSLFHAFEKVHSALGNLSISVSFNMNICSFPGVFALISATGLTHFYLY